VSSTILGAERARRGLGPAGLALLKQFPPRRPKPRWSATEQPLDTVRARLLAPPFVLEAPGTQARRRVGVNKLLAWLEKQPGQTWQDRWLISGADAAGNIEWRHRATEWLRATGGAYQSPKNDFDVLGSGVLALISADVIRPSLSWLLTPGTVQILTAEMARGRDPDGFADLLAVCRRDPANKHTKDGALRRIATIMAAKGGTVRDITVGDCLELVELLQSLDGPVDTSAYFYQLLHGMGVFPVAAPPTVRAVSGRAEGQQSVEMMIDRYQLACRPVRDLLVDYLRERQLAIDYASLRTLAFCLGKLFWKDLEDHHPGISLLRLSPAVAAGWKQRITMKTVRAKTGAGETVETEVRRATGGVNYLAIVRAFYLDLAQWAMDDPARWGVWAAPCPIREEEMSRKKDRSARKSRMDQRTRERLPVLPALARTLDEARGLPLSGLRRPKRPCRVPSSPPPGSGGVERSPRTRPPRCGRTTWRRGGVTTSVSRNTVRSGPGPSSRSCATPASALRSSPSSRITASCNTGCPTAASSSRCSTSPRPRPTSNGCWSSTPSSPTCSARSSAGSATPPARCLS